MVILKDLSNETIIIFVRCNNLLRRDGVFLSTLKRHRLVLAQLPACLEG